MLKRLLLAEDQTQSFKQLKQFLVKNSWSVTSTTDGEEALSLLKKKSYDVLITDLNLLTITGMDLVSRVQLEVNPKPRIIAIMDTDQEFSEVRRRAFEHKVFEFLNKPLNPNSFVESLYRALNTDIKLEAIPEMTAGPGGDFKPPFVGIFIAVGTGGPQTLKKLFSDWEIPQEASLFIVQHGPEWALESIPHRLIRSLNVPARLATDGMLPEKGQIYIAPGNNHLCFNRSDFRCKLVSSLPENFLRPSADPLFRSAAHTFGSYGIGVILSGPTCDGSRGAKVLQEKNGTILVQEPKSAIAPFMPESAIKAIDKTRVVSIDRMSEEISNSVKTIHENLVASSQ